MMTPAEDATDLDSAILQVETLYRSITGKALPAGRTPIPTHADAVRFVRDEADRLIQSYEAFVREPTCPAYVPFMLTTETPNEVVIRIDLPGVPRSAVSVMFSSNALEISGDRPLPDSDDFGEPFVRVIPLPPAALEDEAKATFRDGVLEVHIPIEHSDPAPAPAVDLDKLQMLYDRIHRTIEALEEMRARAFEGHAAVTPQYGFGDGIGASYNSPFQGAFPRIAGLAALGLPLAMPLLRPEMQWLAQGMLPFPWRS